MNKKDLIDSIASKNYITKARAEKIVESLLKEISEGLAKGEKIVVSGFGTFEVRRRMARKGRNPRTGAEIHLPEHLVPHFTPGTGLKKAVR